MRKVEGTAKEDAPDAVFARTSPFQLLRKLDQLLRESLDRCRRFGFPRRALPQDRAVDVAVSDVGHDRRHQPGLLDEDVGPRDKLGEARDRDADVGDLSECPTTRGQQGKRRRAAHAAYQSSATLADEQLLRPILALRGDQDSL